MGSCGECKYFTEEAENIDRGYCLRYPPTVFYEGNEDASHGVSFFPDVSWEDFCGEWVLKFEVGDEEPQKDDRMESIASSLRIIASALNKYALEKFG